MFIRDSKYIAAWVDLGFDDETICLAYERTVLKKGSLNWAYMNSILKSWHQKGLHTLQPVSYTHLDVYKRQRYPVMSSVFSGR